MNKSDGLERVKGTFFHILSIMIIWKLWSKYKIVKGNIMYLVQLVFKNKVLSVLIKKFTAHFFCIILFIMLILQLDFNAILYFLCECSYCQLHKIYLCEIHRASLCLYNKGQDLENIAIIPSDDTKIMSLFL